MVKISYKSILGFIGSLTWVSNSLAYQIKIHFDKQRSFYTSPTIYLTGEEGQNPKIAIKEGVPTTGGVDENEENLTEYNYLSFDITPKINDIRLKIIPNSSEKNSFCKLLNLSIISSLDGNKILLPSTFSKLLTTTTCHFKIVSLDDTNNEVTENKMTLIFNYTLKGWQSDLGYGTKAQITAEFLKEIDANSTTITLVNKNLVNLSPITGFIKAEE